MKLKSIGIFGLARTGESVFDFLKQNFSDIKLIVYDDFLQIESNSKYYEYFININQEDVWNSLDYIIVSPGILQTHKIFDLKPKKISDIELFYILKNSSFDFIKFPKLILAITGTNGKSTITGQIATMLNVAPLGNIGTPIFDYFKFDYSDIIVVEVSSYQNELQNKFRPDILILTNITEDHLDRYLNRESYLIAKLKILNNLTSNDVVIINLDDETLKNISLEGKFKKYPCKFIYMHKNSKDTVEIALINIANLYLNQQLTIENIKTVLQNNYSLDDLIYDYNLENVSLSLYGAALSLAKLQNKTINLEFLESISNYFYRLNSYKGQDFCNQTIATINHIQFINDSKGTNPYSTSKAIENIIKSHKSGVKIFLLAGGIFKNSSIEPIFKFKDFIHKIYLYGQDKLVIQNLLIQQIQSTPYDSLDEALDAALNDAKKIQNNFLNDLKSDNFKIIILLSPMCASLDQFKSFKFRGEYFNKLVENIKLNEQ